MENFPNKVKLFTANIGIHKMHDFKMCTTAVYATFLFKLRWPKAKNILFNKMFLLKLLEIIKRKTNLVKTV